MANVTILCTHNIKPLIDPPFKGPLNLTSWDQIFGVLHTKTVHFYKPSAEWLVRGIDNNPILEILKSSLSQALVSFAPLAGRLRWAGPHQLEVDCNGTGAVLVEAECDKGIEFFEDYDSEKSRRLVPSVDYDRPLHEVPLLLLQLTTLQRGGVSLGIAMSHAVADGQSAFHFFGEWARLARGEALNEAPHLERNILKGGNGFKKLEFSDHVEFSKPPLLVGKQDSSEERKKEIVKLVLPLSKAQVDGLKTAASFANDGKPSSKRFSRYEVVAAHIWRCACKARRHENEQPTAVSIAIDVRNRIKSFTFPKRYFGNAIMVMRATSRVGELISSPLGFACSKLREAIEMVDEDYIWSNVELLEKREDLSFYGQDLRVSSSSSSEDKPFHGNPNLRLISWLTLPIFDMDFGWGNVMHIVSIARDLDGSTKLLPGPKDDGTILVILCLQVTYVEDFKKYFYEDLHEEITRTIVEVEPELEPNCVVAQGL